jgi:phage tail protein X
MLTQYRTSDGDMLDDLCWRHYGCQCGYVEQVLDINPGLADLGPVYATGVVITFPDITPPTRHGPVRLWD